MCFGGLSFRKKRGAELILLSEKRRTRMICYFYFSRIPETIFVFLIYIVSVCVCVCVHGQIIFTSFDWFLYIQQFLLPEHPPSSTLPC